MAFINSQKKHLFDESPSSLLVDRKFDTALRDSKVRQILDNLKLPVEDWYLEEHILVEHGIKNIEHYSIDSTYLPTFLLSCIHYLPTSKETMHFVKNSWHVTHNVVEAQLNWYLSHSPNNKITLLLEKLAKTFHKKTLPIIPQLIHIVKKLHPIVEQLPKVHDYSKTKIKDEEIHDKIAVKRTLAKDKCNMSTATIEELKLDLYWSQHIVIWKHKCKTWILPRVAILQAYNKLCDFLSVILYSTLTEGNTTSDNMTDDIIYFITELCHAHIKDPSIYFTFVSSLEGINLGIILKKTEKWTNTDLYDNIIYDLKNYIQTSEHAQHIIDLMLNRDIVTMNNLSCILKIAGHPMVDVLGGGEKMKIKAREEFDVDPSAVGWCINHLKKTFIKRYILLKKCWPPVDIHEFCHKGLKHAQLIGADPDSKTIIDNYGIIEMHNYSCIDLKKCEIYAEFETLIPLLKDKSVSPGLYNVMKHYFSQDNEYAKEKLTIVDSRLILNYLFSKLPSQDYKDYEKLYLKAVNDNDYEVLAPYLVAKLCPKEREFKEKARMFVSKTAEDRARSNLEEQNAMSYIKKYSKAQALCLDELQLSKRIHALTHLKDIYKGHRVFMVSMDAKNWNLRFRNAAIEPIMRETLDKVYGTNRYQYIQQAYENTLYYVVDYPDSMKWQGQSGGAEGQNQVAWTLSYISMVTYSFRNVPGYKEALIKGDDTRIFLIVPEKTNGLENPNEFAKGLMTTISDTAKMFGQDMKVTESYASEATFAFSKIIHHMDIVLPCDFRKIQKTYGATNAFLPMLDDYIGSTYSNAHSATAYSISPTFTYAISVFWSYYYIYHTPMYNKLSHDEYCVLLQVPNVVGGFPIIFLHNMMVKAESDHLSSFLDLLIYWRIHYPLWYKLGMRFIPKSGSDNLPWTMLLSDPYCLPIRKPPSASIYLRSELQKMLSQKCQCEEIRELISLNPKNQLQNLIRILTSENNWHGKVFSALYELTLDHLLSSMTMIFMTAKSISDYFICTKMPFKKRDNILRNALKKDRQLQYWRYNTLRNENYIITDHFVCPYDWACNLRSTLWKKNILTVTQPPALHQIKVMTEATGSTQNYALDNHFTITKTGISSNPLNVELILYQQTHYLSKKKPFLGSETHPGTSSPTVDVPTHHLILKKISDALMLYCWTSRTIRGITSNCPELIADLISPYTKKNINELAPFTRPYFRGETQHRFRAHGFKDAIAPNIINIHNHFVCEVNTHRSLSGNPNNYRINFLELMCHSIYLCGYELMFGYDMIDEGPYFSVTTDCDCTTNSIEDPAIYFPDYIKNSLRFHTPLKILTLTETGNELLESALEEYKNRISLRPIKLFNNNNDEINEELLKAMVIYLFNKCQRATKSIANSQGLTKLTQEQHNLMMDLHSINDPVQITRSIWRSIPPKIWLTTILPLIYDWVFRHTTSADKHGALLKLDQADYSTFPWYYFCELLIQFQMINRLRQEIENIPNMTTPDNICSIPAVLTGMLAKCSILYDAENTLSFEGIILAINHETDLIIYERCCIKWRNHCWFLFKKLKKPPRSILNEDDLEQLLFFLIYVITPNIKIEDFIYNINCETTRDYCLVLFMHLGLWSPEQYIEFLSNDDHGEISNLIKGIFYYGGTAFKDYLNDMSEERLIDIIENFVPIDIVIDDRITTEAYYVKIHIYDLHDAVETIKSYNVNHYYFMSINSGVQNDILPSLEINETWEGLLYQININMEVAEIESEEELLTTNFPPSDYARIFGSSTTSVSKFLDILNKIGLYHPITRGNGYTGMFLGEGYGGILTGFLLLNKYNRGVYSSLINDFQYNAMPFSALIKDDLMSRIDCESNIQGITDLSKPHTVDYISNNYTHKYHILHCDAELARDKDQAIIVANNVTEIFLRTRQANSLLILKTYLFDIHAIGNILLLLNIHCRHVFILKPISSHPGAEIYIIAQGQSVAYKFMPKLENFPNNTIENTIKTYIKEHNNQLDTWKTKAVVCGTAIYHNIISKNILLPYNSSLHCPLVIKPNMFTTPTSSFILSLIESDYIRKLGYIINRRIPYHSINHLNLSMSEQLTNISDFFQLWCCYQYFIENDSSIFLGRPGYIFLFKSFICFLRSKNIPCDSINMDNEDLPDKDRFVIRHMGNINVTENIVRNVYKTYKMFARMHVIMPSPQTLAIAQEFRRSNR